MAVQVSPDVGATKWIRWLARGTSSIVAGLWLVIGVLHGIGDSEPWTWGSTTITMPVAASALRVLIGWWKEAIGGVALVTAAIIFSAFAWGTAGHSKGFAMPVSGGPFMVASLLFLIVWSRTGKLPATATDNDTVKNGHVD